MKNSKCLGQFPPSLRRSSYGWCWLVFLLLLWGGGSAPVADAAQLTFDELPLSNDGIPIPNGYGGLQWSNFYELDAVTYPRASGYRPGMISQPNVAFNGFGTPASLSSTTPFNLNSGYFTGAWNDGLQLEVKGWIGLTLAYDNTYTLSATAPSLINFNYLGVSSVDFISFGGTPYPGYGTASGTQFAMDNLAVTIVPEPSSVVLLILGMLGWRRVRAESNQ